MLQLACYVADSDPCWFDRHIEQPLWMLLGVFLVGAVAMHWVRGPRRIDWQDDR
jgi:hypothetical protein